MQLAQSGRTIEKNLGKIDLGADEQLDTEVDPLFRQMSGVWRMLGMLVGGALSPRALQSNMLHAHPMHSGI
jgi:hypothetical protein